VLDGSEAASCAGLTIFQSNNNIIRGFVIHSFSEAGIQFIIDPDNPTNGPNYNEISQCYIGTDETGSIDLGNGWEGIAIQGSNNLIHDNLVSGNWMGISSENGSSNNIYECEVGTDRTGSYAIKNVWGISVGGIGNFVHDNLVSGNWMGISTGGHEHIIQNCFVGTNFNGTSPIPNEAFGILVGGENMLIENNLISGNLDNGVVIDGFYSKIFGNKIGTDITGEIPLPNEITGVSVAENAHYNHVKDNIIAFNSRTGVAVTQTAAENTISQNSIFSNEELGIDLGVPYHGDGVTPNDPGDTDTGPNNLMNFPVFKFALAAPGQLVVQGSIDTPKPETVTIEFFANPVPFPGGDPSGHGEGAIFWGKINPNPQGMFTATLPPVSPGTLITATATDMNGNTSEFSKNIEAKAPGNY
jgi:parallel beta-helix repeat protein